ncbi:sensor histidine kinase [Spirosoma spitsbergense]|uniref:sensor histidine kinase n=1 Tax=Spirosoma spitsbergense TaxID=431554 RepID=UPI000367E6FB|nr:7TM-DISM domain-containing protein [Spirosoma spitsbergense]
MNRFRCFWLCVWLSHAAWAQSGPQPLLVGASALPSGELSLREALYHLEDTTGKLTINQAVERQNKGQFSLSNSRTVRQDFGYNTAVQWLYFELETVQKASLMLEIEYANIDDLELFSVQNGVIQSLGHTGDRFSFSHRPYLNNNYVFPLRLLAGERAGYYLRFNRPNAILSFFIRLWPRTVFLHTDRDEYFAWGIYIGVICLVLIVAVVMLLATKDRIYLWFGLYIHFMTMHLFSDAGLGFQYLWPNTPRINELAPVYLYIWAAMIAQLTFMQFFIRQTALRSRIYRWNNGFKLVVLITLLAVIGIQLSDVAGRELYLYKFTASATRYFVIALITLTALSLWEHKRRSSLRQQEKLVRYYTYALLIQFSGFVLVSLINWCQDRGWPLPFDVLTYVIMGVTVFLDIVFFSYGLAYRYQVARQINRTLELDLLTAHQQTQQRVIDALEEERQRLAQDLHDDIGPTLSVAKGYLSVLTRTEKTGPLMHAQTLLDEAAHELRTLSHQLMPKHLEQTGLAEAIDETIRKKSGMGTQFQFISLGDVKRLPAQTERLLFGIATELIQQVQHQNHATEATVQLIYHPGYLNLTVEDNGPAQPDYRDERSLPHLLTKAEFLNADLLIETNEQGHSVMLTVPFPTA